MAKIFGKMVCLAQFTPKTSVKFFRLLVAASRMEKTQSPSQDMHKLESFSSKNSTPYRVPQDVNLWFSLKPKKKIYQLRGKERNVFNDGQANTPLLVLGQLDNSRK
jgi:hypothetical protein